MNKEIQSHLYRFAQRPIKAGEAFILARLLADKIPNLVETPQDSWSQPLKYREKVDLVIFTLNDYIHINPETRESIYRMSERLWAWRQSIASGTSELLFSGEQNCVVDDMGGMLRYVPLSDLSTVGDIANDANYIYSLFKAVILSCWTSGE